MKIDKEWSLYTFAQEIKRKFDMKSSEQVQGIILKSGEVIEDLRILFKNDQVKFTVFTIPELFQKTFTPKCLTPLEYFEIERNAA